MAQILIVTLKSYHNVDIHCSKHGRLLGYDIQLLRTWESNIVPGYKFKDGLLQEQYWLEYIPAKKSTINHQDNCGCQSITKYKVTKVRRKFKLQAIFKYIYACIIFKNLAIKSVLPGGKRYIITLTNWNKRLKRNLTKKVKMPKKKSRVTS